jgi:hypothetical protein
MSNDEKKVSRKRPREEVDEELTKQNVDDILRGVNKRRKFEDVENILSTLVGNGIIYEDIEEMMSILEQMHARKFLFNVGVKNWTCLWECITFILKDISSITDKFVLHEEDFLQTIINDFCGETFKGVCENLNQSLNPRFVKGLSAKIQTVLVECSEDLAFCIEVEEEKGFNVATSSTRKKLAKVRGKILYTILNLYFCGYSDSHYHSFIRHSHKEIIDGKTYSMKRVMDTVCTVTYPIRKIDTLPPNTYYYLNDVQCPSRLCIGDTFCLREMDGVRNRSIQGMIPLGHIMVPKSVCCSDTCTIIIEKEKKENESLIWRKRNPFRYYLKVIQCDLRVQDIMYISHNGCVQLFIVCTCVNVRGRMVG